MRSSKFIKPTNIKGAITAPSSKSDMLRAVAAAYLTGDECEIVYPSFCEDAKAALHIVEMLGVRLERHSEAMIFAPGQRLPNPTLDCGESGLCIRMFPSIAALLDDKVTLTGGGSLASRPMTMVEQPLKDLGVECSTEKGFLPITVQGPLQAGKTVVDASTSSQFLTGLLMGLPLCDGISEIIVSQLKSKPYIEMTLSLLTRFGIEIENQQFERFIIHGAQKYKAISYRVEGDWSGASCLLVAGALSGSVRVENISDDSYQADKAILDALQRAGARVEISDNGIEVYNNRLNGFEFDATDCPDLFPALVALAVYCEGKTVIYGAQRLKVKESDRGTALLTEFRKMGASIALYPDRMEILGGTPLDGGTVDSYNDHRIAMACAVAALGSKHGVTIGGAECVAKSYPEFFDDVEKLRG